MRYDCRDRFRDRFFSIFDHENDHDHELRRGCNLPTQMHPSNLFHIAENYHPMLESRLVVWRNEFFIALYFCE